MRVGGAVDQRLRVVQAATTVESVRKCGRVARPGAQLTVERRFDAARLEHYDVVTGSVACRRVWVCPRCQARECLRRSNEVVEIVENRQGARVWTGVVTTGHTVEDPLRGIFDHLLSVWSDYAGVGCVRTLYASRFVEVTYGDSGWHPHIHALVVCDGDEPPEWWASLQQANALRSLASGRKYTQKANALQPWRSDVDALSYFSKGTLTPKDPGELKEVTGKSGGTRSLIALYKQAGVCKHAAALVAEYEQTTRRRHMWGAVNRIAVARGP